MEWSGATIENDGFSMVLGQPTIGNHGFSMVGHHWSNDGMVTYDRRSLVERDIPFSANRVGKESGSIYGAWLFCYSSILVLP